MHDSATAVASHDVDPDTLPEASRGTSPIVSTHVLVEQEKVYRLRRLASQTRVRQSEYLREAVDDLLAKYNRLAEAEGA